MDDSRFDGIAKALATTTTRRTTLARFASGGVGALALARIDRAAADDKDGKDKDHKTCLCHATGSTSNPYVLICVDDNALAAHERHQDGRDIIPAPKNKKGKRFCPKKKRY